VDIDVSLLEKLEKQMEEMIEGFYAKFPPETKEEYDQRKLVSKQHLEPSLSRPRSMLMTDSKREGDEGGERPVLRFTEFLVSRLHA